MVVVGRNVRVRREAALAGASVSISSAAAFGCGPAEGHCDAVAIEPQCGETIEPTIVDRVGVPEAHAIARDGARWMLGRAFGDYVSGVAGVYIGGARVTIEGEWGESFELVDELGTVTPGDMADPRARFQSREETGRRAIDVRQALGEGEVEVACASNTDRGSCGANGLELARSSDRITTTLTCRHDDPPATAEVVLDYERIAPEDVSLDDALLAASMTFASPSWEDRLVPCGSGRVYDTEFTFTETTRGDWGATTLYVDTRTIWYVAEQCPQTHGATRIESSRAPVRRANTAAGATRWAVGASATCPSTTSSAVGRESGVWQVMPPLSVRSGARRPGAGGLAGIFSTSRKGPSSVELRSACRVGYVYYGRAAGSRPAGAGILGSGPSAARRHRSRSRQLGAGCVSLRERDTGRLRCPACRRGPPV
jgi:hypothetical protein